MRRGFFFLKKSHCITQMQICFINVKSTMKKNKENREQKETYTVCRGSHLKDEWVNNRKSSICFLGQRRHNWYSLESFLLISPIQIECMVRTWKAWDVNIFTHDNKKRTRVSKESYRRHNNQNTRKGNSKRAANLWHYRETNFGGPARNTDLVEPLILDPNLIQSHATLHYNTVHYCIYSNILWGVLCTF